MREMKQPKTQDGRISLLPLHILVFSNMQQSGWHLHIVTKQCTKTDQFISCSLKESNLGSPTFRSQMLTNTKYCDALFLA